jgi:Entner-Doudoroff aldolase
MKKADVRARIEEIGIIPGIRVSKPDRARFAAQAVHTGGIPIAEITMTVPGAIEVISYLTKTFPEMVVGAGTVLDCETAHRCRDAGAKFLTSTGLVTEVVEFALKNDVIVFPGACTPTEVIDAWKAALSRYGWRQLHPFAKAAFPPDSSDRHRRGEPVDSGKFHPGRGHGIGHRSRADQPGGSPRNERRTDL